MGAFCADRGPSSSAAALVVLPACLALSTGVEFTQLWFPPRVSSLNDIAAQFVGATFGSALWLVCGQAVTRWARRVWATAGTQGLVSRLLPGYLGLLFFMYGMPFNLTISPADLYHKWRGGAIRLVPFVAPDIPTFQLVRKYCWTVALFLPLGLLLANVRHPALQRARNWWRALAVGVAATSLIQCLKLFVASRFVDSTEVVVGSLAVLAGWGLALGLRYRRQTGAATPRRNTVLLGLLLLVWLAVGLFVNWEPFDFQWDAGFALGRLRGLPLLPFADYLNDVYINVFDESVHKVLLFVPLGALLTLIFSSTVRGRGALVLLVAAVLAAGFEAGQLFLPTRYPSVTDVLVETSGAFVGLILTRRAQWLLTPSSAPQPAYRGATSSAVRAPIHIRVRN